jgi:hypothetical protein
MDAVTARLWFVLAANLAVVGALVGVGVTAHSLGVLAEGVDYPADAAAIGVSLLAIHLSARPTTPAHPDGYPRATRFAVDRCRPSITAPRLRGTYPTKVHDGSRPMNANSLACGSASPDTGTRAP